MIKDAVSHVGPAKARTRKRPSCEHLEFFDNRKDLKIARSYPQSTVLKMDITSQSFIYEHLKIDTDSSRNLVKESAKQTENSMMRRMMNWTTKNEEFYRCMDEIDIVSTLSLSDEFHGQGNSDELNKVQLQAQEFVSSTRKESSPRHGNEETPLHLGSVLEGKAKPFFDEGQHGDFVSINDHHLNPNDEAKQNIENQLEHEIQGSSACNEKGPANNQNGKQHMFSDLKEIKHVSLTVVSKSVPIAFARRKLLILDVNGLLADVVSPPPKECKAEININRRAIFKRPFYDEFLKFCFERFDVGIWSSRSKKIFDRVVDYLLGDMKNKLLFCWDLSHCTETGFSTLENRHKPLVCKELRKIWEKEDPNLPWKKGDYDESNTLLLDDSPYKALLNPMHTAIFPYSYNYKDRSDKSLGPGGDIRVYVENLASAENMKKYVEQHPFGQSGIDETSSFWEFYSKVLGNRNVVQQKDSLL